VHPHAHAAYASRSSDAPSGDQPRLISRRAADFGTWGDRRSKP
jgi:hypothetical protein